MNFVPVFQLPDPLKYKIAEWNLPPAVLLKLLEVIEARLRELYFADTTLIKPVEVAICDPGSNMTYRFAGRVAARKYNGMFVIVDCDFDFYAE